MGEVQSWSDSRLAPQKAVAPPFPPVSRWNGFPIRYPNDAGQRMGLRGVKESAALHFLPRLGVQDVIRFQG